MNFKTCIDNGWVRIIQKDDIRAKSLIKSSKESIETAKIIPLKEMSYKSILRELYEGLRQFCEGIGYIKGYKFENHVAITFFIRDVLNETEISNKFDRYRELRNSVNYYGKEINKETVLEMLKEIDGVIKLLEEYI